MVKDENIATPGMQPSLKLTSFHLTKLKFDISSEHWDKGDLPETEFSITYAQISQPERKDYLGIEFKLFLKSTDKSVDLVFKFIGHFQTSGIDVTDKTIDIPLYRLNAPAILFPYTRAFLSNFILNAGFKPIILPTLNFFETQFKIKSRTPSPILPKGLRKNKSE